MRLLRIILARVLFQFVVKLVEAEERAMALAPMKRTDRWRP